MTAAPDDPSPARPCVRDDDTGSLRLAARALVRTATMLMVVKAFFVDASLVCTRSMEPTIVGRDTGGDVVLFERLPFRVAAPRRYDVVFFRYRNNREITYLKRVVGLPGEEIGLLDGDLWLLPPGDDSPVAEAAAAGRAIRLRRPAALERAAFAQRPLLLPAEAGAFGRRDFDRLFEVAPGDRAAFVALKEGGVRCTPAPGAEPLATFVRPPTDYLPDAVDLRAGSPAPRAGTGGSNPAPDLALEFELTLPAGGEAVLRLDHPLSGVRHVARFRASAGGVVLLEGPDDGAAARGAAPELASGAATVVRFARVDGLLRATIDGRVVVEAETPWRPTRRDARGLVAFGASGAGAEFRRPRIERDVVYVADGLARWTIPADGYLCLGDHPADSSDARHWREIVIEDLATGEILHGDADGMRAGVFRNEGRNPVRRADGAEVFTDRDDRERVFPNPEARRLLGEYRTPYVSRDAIVGRAAFVLWPPSRAGVVR